MVSYALPSDEPSRLAALYAMAVLDTPPEDQFDRLTRLAAHLFNVPVATISLIDTDRQWLKSSFGLDVVETSRDVSFCTHTILGTEPLIVKDALADVRFANNPLVQRDFKIRFYAGVPLPSIGGHNVGSFCLIDTTPRTLTEAEAAVLRDLAAIARDLLRARESSQHYTRLYAAARTQEQVFQESFDLVGLGMLHIQAADGKILHSNRRAREILGYGPDDLLALAGLPVEDLEGLQDRIAALLEGAPGPLRLEVPYDHPDSGTRWLSWTFALHNGPSGAILVTTIDDVSTRKRHDLPSHSLRHSLGLGGAEDASEAVALHRQIALRAERDHLAAEKKLRLVTDAIPALIGYWDRDEKFRFANQHYLEWFGIPPERLIGLPLKMVVGDAAYFQALPHIKGALAGTRQQFDRPLARADGTLRQVRTHYIPHVEDGVVQGVCVLAEDLG